MPVVHEPVSLAELADEIVNEYAAVAEQGQRAVRTDARRDLPPAIADRLGCCAVSSPTWWSTPFVTVGSLSLKVDATASRHRERSPSG